MGCVEPEAVSLILKKHGQSSTHSAKHVAVHVACLLSLVGHDLVELCQAVCECRENMRLELREAVLHREHVVAVVVLFLDLLVQTVVHLTLKDVWVITSFDAASSRVKRSRVLAQELNVLLRDIARLVNSFGALARALAEFLCLVLDLSVQALKDGEHRALQRLGGLRVAILNPLSVGSDVVKKPSNTTEALVEMVTLFQRTAHSLQDLLVILGGGRVHLAGCFHIVLEIDACMLPCLEALVEQLRNLAAILVWNRIVGGGGGGARRQVRRLR